MATRTTEATNTLETFRVNFNALVDDIGNVTVTNAGDQLNTTATSVVGAINEIFAGMQLSAQINSYGSATFLQSSNAETLTLKGGTGIHSGGQSTNIVTDITADDTMNNNEQHSIEYKIELKIVRSRSKEIVRIKMEN